MVKFKRINIKNFSEEKKEPYILNDIVNQKSIELIVKNYTATSKTAFRNCLLKKYAELLDLMLIEK